MSLRVVPYNHLIEHRFLTPLCSQANLVVVLEKQPIEVLPGLRYSNKSFAYFNVCLVYGDLCIHDNLFLQESLSFHHLQKSFRR
jgi:hypothetical protein